MQVMRETQKIIEKIETLENCFCITLINGQKNPAQVFATQIALDILPLFYEILEKKGKVEKLALVIRSNGGIIDTPLPVINLLREYCQTLLILVPENAHSAATLISLGGNEIVMTPISSLSPIDPQIPIPQTQVENKPNNVKIHSVEDISGYYELLDKLKITEDGKIKALELIAKTLDPIILGQIERVRELIRIYADRILSFTEKSEEAKKLIIEKLVEQIPSHNYMISRKEALDIGLPVKSATDEQHGLLKSLMKLYKTDLKEDEKELIINFEPGKNTNEQFINRAFIETKDQCYSFVTKYVFHQNGKIDTTINQWQSL